MSSPQVTFQSVTGVDVELQIAGPGSRSYAFVIDWHIRLILALAWFFGGTIVLLGSLAALGQTEPGSQWLWWVLLPSLIIYFLYHPVLEIAMHGRTPGKRIAGVRLVTRSGDIPGAGALLLRNIFRILDSLPFAYLLGLMLVVFTEHHVRAGDLAAGTLLVMDHDSSAGSFAGLGSVGKAGLSPQAADLVQELLDRWQTLDDEKRTGIARSLLARLDRTVSAEEIASLDSAALRSRLSALVSPVSTPIST
jgi:uncharacterized RDD family membrane protein YckC